MSLYFVYAMVQKSQKWPETQIKEGSCLGFLFFFDGKKDSFAENSIIFSSVL